MYQGWFSVIFTHHIPFSLVWPTISHFCDIPVKEKEQINEEQIIHSYLIDGAGGSGRYRWFVYITTLLFREASGILDCIVGDPNYAAAPSIMLVLSERH